MKAKILLLGPLLILGCGKVAGKPGGIPAAQAPREIAKAVCPKAYSCCSAAQLMGNDYAGTDEPDCEKKTEEAFRNQLQPVVASEARFRSDYDGVKLEACLAYIRASSCETLGKTSHFSGIPGCDKFVEGRLAIGEACTHDWECVDGWCENPTPTSDGTCRPLSRAGESCASVKCLAGLICDSMNKTCTAPLADGQVCARDDQCASRSCAGPVAGSGACMPAQGGACFYASACSAAGAGRPGPLALLLFLSIAAAAAVRRAAGTATPRRRSTAARRR